MWLLTIHQWICSSPVLLLVALSGNMYTQPTMFPMLIACKASAASAFLTCTNFEMGCKLPECSGIVVSARATQYSTKTPSWFRSLILNCRCSCHGRCPFNMLYHLSGHCVTHTQSFRLMPPHQLQLPVHRQMWDMRILYKPSTWTSRPW